MASLNKVCLLGNVGKDPEIRYSQGGDPIASFSIATSEKWKDKAGNQQERTEWHNLSVFGGLAKIVRDYVTKGKQVYVEGQIRTEEWTDKEGQKRKSTKVFLSGPRAVLVLLGGGNGNGNGGGKGRGKPAGGSYGDHPDDDGGDDWGDDEAV